MLIKVTYAQISKSRSFLLIKKKSNACPPTRLFPLWILLIFISFPFNNMLIASLLDFFFSGGGERVTSHEGRGAFTSFSSTPGPKTFTPHHHAPYMHASHPVSSQRLCSYDVITLFRIFSVYVFRTTSLTPDHVMCRDYMVFLANTVFPGVNNLLVFKFGLVVHRPSTKTILPPPSQLSEVFFLFLRKISLQILWPALSGVLLPGPTVWLCPQVPFTPLWLFSPPCFLETPTCFLAFLMQSFLRLHETGCVKYNCLDFSPPLVGV